MNKNTNLGFEEIIHNHYNEIFHYIRKQTSNTEDAKDLTQEVFMKIYQKFHLYDSNKSSIRTWIYRIAHNHVINHFNKKYNKYKLDIDDQYLDYVIDENEDILDLLIKSEDIKYITIIIGKILNKKHQKILNLYFFSELSIEEIAESLKAPIKTIYNTINVSIQKIKKEMEGHLYE